MKKSINKEAFAIQRRFFQALDALIQSERLAGLKSFCVDNDLNRTKYSLIKNTLDKPIEETTYKIIDLDALSSICRDYGVRPDWLLLGRGEMFRKGGKQ